MAGFGRGGTGSDTGRGFLGEAMSLNVSSGVGACSCWLANIPSSFGLTGLLESSSKPKPHESHVLALFACSIGDLALLDIRFADARLAKGGRGVPKSIVVDLE